MSDTPWPGQRGIRYTPFSHTFRMERLGRKVDGSKASHKAGWNRTRFKPLNLEAIAAC